MTRTRTLMLALAATFALPAAASAQELFGGIHAHAVGTRLSLGSSREGGIDGSIGYRTAPIASLLKIEPYAFGSLNSKGDTSFVAVGISRRFGDRFYIRPGVGLAIHNGSAKDFVIEDRIAFGSRILIETELGVGTRLNDRLSIEASWVHLSHGQLFGGQNPGIDNIGARINLKL